MADVFISYSRRDSDVAGRLADALTGRGRDVWIDRKDIAPTAEWRDEIGAGIESSDALAFLISPDSLQSEVCSDELSAALERNKRIAPLVVREPNGVPVPDALARHNWIFFRDGDDFDAAVDKLVAALDTDLDWVHAHTRLLVRSAEWERSDRDRSFLLSGSDLQAAESWLARKGPGDNPSPTRQQREYVVASRHNQTRRQRRTLAGVVAALVVAIALAIVALVQRSTAISNEKAAKSEEFAALARSQLGTDPQLGLAMAEAAYKLKPTDAAAAALRIAAFDDDVVATFQGHRGAARAAAFVGTGQVASAGDDGTIRLWTVGRHTARVFRSGGGMLFALAVSPDARTVAAGAGDGTVRLVENGALKELPTGSTSPVETVAFSRDGRRLVAANLQGAVIVWDLSSGRSTRLGAASDSIWSAEFSPDGSRVVTAGNTGVNLWDARRPGQPTRLGAAAEIWSAAFSPDGGRLAVADNEGKVRVWDVQAARALDAIDAHLHAIAFSPDGSRIAGAGDDGAVRVWDLQRIDRPLVMRGHEGGVLSIGFGPDGRRLVTAGHDGTVRIWDAGGNGSPALIAANQGQVGDAEFDRSDRRLVTVGHDSTVRVWSLEAPSSPVVVQTHTGVIYGAAFSPTDPNEVVTGSDLGVGLWDLTTRRGAHAIAASPVFTTGFTPDGKEIVSGEFNARVDVNDLHPGGTFHGIPTGQRYLLSARLAHDGRRVVTAGYDGTVKIIDLAGRRRPLVLRGHQGVVVDAVFSPDGREVVSGGNDGTVRVWDASTGTQRTVLTGIQGSVQGVSFSPDGRWVAAGGVDGSLRVWDWRAPGAAADPVTLLTEPDKLNSTTFAHHGDLIAAASRDGYVRVVHCMVCEPTATLLHQTDARLKAQLTPSERNYLARFGLKV